MASTLKCKVCGIEIEKGNRGSGKLYCSISCGWRARNEKRRVGTRGQFRIVSKSSKSEPGQATSGPTIASAADWKRYIQEKFELGPTELALLNLAASALDASIRAAALVERDGLILSGQPHPGLQIADVNARAFRALVKQLNFPIETDEGAHSLTAVIR